MLPSHLIEDFRTGEPCEMFALSVKCREWCRLGSPRGVAIMVVPGLIQASDSSQHHRACRRTSRTGGLAPAGDLVTHVTLGARGRDVTAPAARLLEINMRCQADIISALSSRLDLPASVSSSPRLVPCSGVLVVSLLRGARVTSISDMRYRAALRKVQTDDAASVLRFGRCGQGRGLHRPWSPPVLTM